MKLSSAMLLTVITSAALMSGCSKLGNIDTGTLTDSLNTVAGLTMPVKVNDTFTVTKFTKISDSTVALDLDLAKNATQPIDKYINSELQGQLANGVICRLPELKAGKTSVTLNIFQDGTFKKSISKSSKFLCN